MEYKKETFQKRGEGEGETEREEEGEMLREEAGFGDG